jgi:hypothetical protein
MFFQFFALNFKFLGIKKLIATHFASDKQSYKLELFADINGDGKINQLDTIKTFLKGNGDFRSPECIEILKECDIVVTNPPFSLFREYISQLIEYDKKFLVIGNINAITYKEIFKVIKDNKLWLGVTNFNDGMYFEVPQDFVYSDTYKFEREREGKKVSRVPGVCWFTNIPHKKRNEDILLYKKYYGNESEYTTYDNYDAIEVSKVKDIPVDYDGLMGVPITFLDKFNPNQFEIIWTTDRGGDGMLEDYKKKHDRFDSPVVNGKGIYKRIIIKKKFLE